MSIRTIAVIGGAGHVGLPFGIHLAKKGFEVIGIDRNKELCDKINQGQYPYVEKGGEESLREVLWKQTFAMHHDLPLYEKPDCIAIMLGTPVDEEGNPRIEPLFECIDQYSKYLNNGTLLLLRSTVAPGTTYAIYEYLFKKGIREGADYHLVFAPERVAQGYALEEADAFPQIIGVMDEQHEETYQLASTLFNETIKLTLIEAEYAKLITNMYRYVNFALANEMYMLAQNNSEYFVDMHKIIKAANHGYPRMNMPLPGPNVGGPCLFKDGKFLLQGEPYVDLIRTSFHINESMPEFIYQRYLHGKARVAILGMTFKKDNDDTRNSLSFKLKKVCRNKGVEVMTYDPYINPDFDFSDLAFCDAVVLMTPHTKIINQWPEMKKYLDRNTLVVDIWRALSDVEFNNESSRNGIFYM